MEAVFAAGRVMAEKLDEAEAEIERLTRIEEAARKLVETYGAGPARPCSRHPDCGYIGCDMAVPAAKAWDALKAALTNSKPEGSSG